MTYNEEDYQTHRESRIATQKRYYNKNKEKILQRYRAYRERNKEKLNLIRRLKNAKNRIEVREQCRISAKKSYDRNRTGLINALGGKCSNPTCLVPSGCTDIRCLQIDHINGGGKKEILKFISVNIMYSYYFKNLEEAKQKLQILCANCNWIKRYENNEKGGACLK